MKYIVIKGIESGMKEPIIFADTIKHSDMAQSLKPAEVLSAGFVAFDENIMDKCKLYCYGYSMSLNLSANNSDAKLIKVSLTGEIKWCVLNVVAQVNSRL